MNCVKLTISGVVSVFVRVGALLTVNLEGETILRLVDAVLEEDTKEELLTNMYCL